MLGLGRSFGLRNFGFGYQRKSYDSDDIPATNCLQMCRVKFECTDFRTCLQLKRRQRAKIWGFLAILELRPSASSMRRLAPKAKRLLWVMVSAQSSGQFPNLFAAEERAGANLFRASDREKLSGSRVRSRGTGCLEGFLLGGFGVSVLWGWQQPSASGTCIWSLIVRCRLFVGVSEFHDFSLS